MREAKDADSKDQMLLKDMKHRLGQRRWVMERNWYGNILFYLGQQWVMYDPLTRRWRLRRLANTTPTPVTNLFRSTLDTVKSAVAQHDPRFLGVPIRDTARAIAAAAATDQYLQVIMREGNLQLARRAMMDWLLLTGNAFMEVGWDDSEETGMDAVPLEVCQDCGATTDPSAVDVAAPVCPKCGSPYIVESSDQFVWTPRGSIRIDPLSPFEIMLDGTIENLEDQPFILVAQSFTEEQVQMRWDKKVYGGGPQDFTNASLISKESLAGIGSGASTNMPFGYMAGGDWSGKRVVVFRAFIKKCEEYPKGAYIAMTASGKLLEKSTPYPYKTHAGNGRSFYPIVHYKFGTLGGRAWGFSPADDLQPKQYQLNKAESLLTMIVSRMANPVWLIPANSNPSRISGDIGIQIEYTPVGTQAPQRVPGAEAPQTLIKYISDIRESFDELSGAFSAVRGRTMGSRTPVGTVQSLQERGFGRWATVFSGLEEGYQDLAKKSLEIWRQNAHTPRVLAIKNAVGGFTFQEFMGADWDDGVEVEVETGSTRPKSQAEKMQMYMQLGQTGVLDFMDESQKVKMLDDLGLMNMRPGVEEDQKDAYQENAQFMEWARQIAQNLQAVPDPAMRQMFAQQLAMQMPVRVVPIVDDHAVHFLTHRHLAMTPEFKALPPEIQQAWYMHMMQHQGDVMMSKIIKQMPQAPGNGPPQQSLAPGQQSGGGKPGAGPGGGSPHQAPTREMQGGQSNPGHNK